MNRLNSPEHSSQEEKRMLELAIQIVPNVPSNYLTLASLAELVQFPSETKEEKEHDEKLKKLYSNPGLFMMSRGLLGLTEIGIRAELKGWSTSNPVGDTRFTPILDLAFGKYRDQMTSIQRTSRNFINRDPNFSMQFKKYPVIEFSKGSIKGATFVIESAVAGENNIDGDLILIRTDGRYQFDDCDNLFLNAYEIGAKRIDDFFE